LLASLVSAAGEHPLGVRSSGAYLRLDADKFASGEAIVVARNTTAISSRAVRPMPELWTMNSSTSRYLTGACSVSDWPKQGYILQSSCTIVVNSMPARLNHELIAAAIDGFEEQKRRINAQIAELRRMLSGGSSGDGADSSGSITKRRRMSAASRARIAAAQRKRWAAKRARASA
jgi:hypothetical protein